MAATNTTAKNLLAEWGWTNPAPEMTLLARQCIACRQYDGNPFRVGQALLALTTEAFDAIDAEYRDAVAGGQQVSIEDFTSLTKLSADAATEVYSCAMGIPYIKGLAHFRAADEIAADEDLRDLCERDNLSIIRNDCGVTVVCPSIQKLDELQSGIAGDHGSTLSIRLSSQGITVAFATAPPAQIAEHRKMALSSISVSADRRASILEQGIKPLTKILATEGLNHLSLDTNASEGRWITAIRVRTAAGSWMALDEIGNAQVAALASALKTIFQQAGCAFDRMTKASHEFQTGFKIGAQHFLLDVTTTPTIAGGAIVNLTFLDTSALVSSDTPCRDSVAGLNGAISVAMPTMGGIADAVTRYAQTVAAVTHAHGINSITFLLNSFDDEASAQAIAAIGGPSAIYCPASREEMLGAAKALVMAGKRTLAIGNVSHSASSEAFAMIVASMGISVIGHSHHAGIASIQRQFDIAAAEFGIASQVRNHAAESLNEI